MRHRFATDRWLFVSTVVLCLVGAVMVFSASAVTAREQFNNAYYFLIRQTLFLVVGLAAMFVLMNVDYRKLRKPAVIFSALAIVILMLVAVFFLDKSHATHRWIRYGGVGIQPSEIAKLVVILYLAWLLAERMAQGPEVLNDWRRTLLPALAPVLLLAGLVLIQPDLGTAVEIFLIALVMLFVSGVSLKWVLGPAVAVLPIIICLVVFVPWRFHRLMSFRHPESDPRGRGFSTAAIIDRGRFRRTERRGIDGEPPKTFLSAGSADRFYFRGVVRRTWLHRRPSGSGIICRLRMARIPSGAEFDRSL